MASVSAIAMRVRSWIDVSVVETAEGALATTSEDRAGESTIGG
jgi:hypothetical protein